MPWPRATDRSEAACEKIPIDLSGQPHQRMAQVDDVLQGRTKQVVLAVVTRLAHRCSSTANLAIEGITNRPNRESENARKPAGTPRFLAKSITCSDQIAAINQWLPDTSRTTNYTPQNAAPRAYERDDGAVTLWPQREYSKIVAR